ncbi:MAG TPA: UDP-N-acetylmuramoyl-tripeptide--D-alanyl-D-alanine ligase [Xanthomonadaceae bacterium]|nr:UDP-N-acetylmuramoyl-tripeptide--D-alanyl-D-alanine ligase [Xanthomonadaceae bacterium]
MTLEQVARATGGRVVAPADGLVVDRVATDTRVLGGDPGTLFIALRGERFDGHDHAAAAAAAGVRALLVAREVDVPLPQVVVADTTRALADLAAAAQDGRTGTVVAITGSNGKTSVKALALSILQRVGNAYANPGNRNNEIGLPLAVIDAPEDADFAIYEMGAGQPGDIAVLTAVVRPDVALVNNIAPAHLERMGSLLGVADTKAAIYDALPAGGVAVINADDAFAPFFAERAHGRTLLRFGIEASADIRARGIRADAAGSRFVLAAPQGEAEVVLALPGRHNVRNALAAASLALAAGATLADVVAGLQAARAVAGRLVAHRLRNGATLVDDSYNANPGSLQAAIETLASSGAEAWLVLGDMRELGQDATALHAEAGRQARAAGIARLYALGSLAGEAARTFGDGGRVFERHEALVDALAGDIAAEAPPAQANRGLTVLVKGSRGSAMDRIVAGLLASHGKGDADAA